MEAFKNCQKGNLTATTLFERSEFVVAIKTC